MSRLLRKKRDKKIIIMESILNRTCVDCHYSGNGTHGCNRLMKGIEPEIDKSKGVECAHNGFVHYLSANYYDIVTTQKSNSFEKTDVGRPKTLKTAHTTND